jgi:hypothetical protein
LPGRLAHLICGQCHRQWDDPAEQGRVYWTDDEPPGTATFCPDCADREFAEAEA